MIYGGSSMSNFTGAMMSKDKSMAKNVFISGLHKVIEQKPSIIIGLLKKNGIEVTKGVSTKTLIHLTVENLYDNKQFRDDVSKVVLSDGNKYSNAIGDDVKDSASKIGEGASTGGIVGAIAGAVNSIFSTAGKFKDAKTQKEADKQQLIRSLMDDKPKTNWLPIIIISSVLVVGGIIMAVSLKSNK